MQISFLLGPAGSGKTFRCLDDIRSELLRDPEGKPLIFLAPKQATFQLERQLLENAALKGYTRLHISSFDRLARFIFDAAGAPLPNFISEEGRTMVLRALLNRHEPELHIFRGAARRQGFAEELAGQIREFTNHGLTPEHLAQLSSRVPDRQGLRQKLQDFALIFTRYREWLKEERLQEADALLGAAADLLDTLPDLQVGGLWLDGFAQLTPEERRLLVSLLGFVDRGTLAFCVEADKAARSPISPWYLVSQTLSRLKTDIETRYKLKANIEVLPRSGDNAGDCRPTRFSSSPALSHLERHWIQAPTGPAPESDNSVHIYECADPEAEAVCCARSIFQHVKNGGRYRETAVLVRDFNNDYPHVLRRVFRRYGIPFFIDHRENVSHHPLAELTRGTLRTIAFDWEQRDWFTVLKSGLIRLPAEELDQLENEALARGWKGAVWREGLSLPKDPTLERDMNRRRERIIPPFIALREALEKRPTGTLLADALRLFWRALSVQEQLEDWSRESAQDAVHRTVWEQMNAWLDDVALAFADQPLYLRQWLPILEAGLSSLTVGVIPPVLDEVLIGSVDRSRNPDLKLLCVLGFNEKIFPAVPRDQSLLTEDDRTSLLAAGSDLIDPPALKLAAEQFYGYIACTRARERLHISYSRSGLDGKALNPSRFIAQLTRIFSDLTPIPWTFPQALEEVVHRCELPFLGIIPEGESLTPPQAEKLSPETVARLYGNSLSVSVSALERFASCPFRFFVERGLKVHEREELQLDVREQGSFQHAVLARFHEEATKNDREWRHLSVSEARALIAEIADDEIKTFREGLLTANEQNRFTAETYKANLQEFIEAIIRWFDTNDFNPRLVEFAFGQGSDLPGWKVNLSNGKSILIHGRVDRIDVHRDGNGENLCVIIDYKSGVKEPNRTLMYHGIQQQLTAYLVAVTEVKEIALLLGLKNLTPAGCFYVPLSARYEGARTRRDISPDKETARVAGYTHNGVFNHDYLQSLDSDARPGKKGQFKYWLTKSLKGHGGGINALDRERFEGQLDRARALIREIGERIFEGDIDVRPYKGAGTIACATCHMQPVCRFDSWTQNYNRLTPPPKPAK